MNTALPVLLTSAVSENPVQNVMIFVIACDIMGYGANIPRLSAYYTGPAYLILHGVMQSFWKR